MNDNANDKHAHPVLAVQPINPSVLAILAMLANPSVLLTLVLR